MIVGPRVVMSDVVVSSLAMIRFTRLERIEPGSNLTSIGAGFSKKKKYKNLSYLIFQKPIFKFTLRTQNVFKLEIHVTLCLLYITLIHIT